MPKVITDLKLTTDEEGVQHLVMKSVELRTFGSQMFENPITGEESDWEPVPLDIEVIQGEIILGTTEETIDEPVVIPTEEPSIEDVVKQESDLPTLESLRGIAEETAAKPIKDNGW